MAQRQGIYLEYLRSWVQCLHSKKKKTKKNGHNLNMATFHPLPFWGHTQWCSGATLGSGLKSSLMNAKRVLYPFYLFYHIFSHFKYILPYYILLIIIKTIKLVINFSIWQYSKLSPTGNPNIRMNTLIQKTLILRGWRDHSTGLSTRFVRRRPRNLIPSMHDYAEPLRKTTEHRVRSSP